MLNQEPFLNEDNSPLVTTMLQLNAVAGPLVTAQHHESELYTSLFSFLRYDFLKHPQSFALFQKIGDANLEAIFKRELSSDEKAAVNPVYTDAGQSKLLYTPTCLGFNADYSPILHDVLPRGMLFRLRPNLFPHTDAFSVEGYYADTGIGIAKSKKGVITLKNRRFVKREYSENIYYTSRSQISTRGNSPLNDILIANAGLTESTVPKVLYYTLQLAAMLAATGTQKYLSDFDEVETRITQSARLSDDFTTLQKSYTKFIKLNR